jgi:hypothetical protein
MREKRGVAVSRTLLRRRMAAMPCRLYKVRLVQNGSANPIRACASGPLPSSRTPATGRWFARGLLEAGALRPPRYYVTVPGLPRRRADPACSGLSRSAGLFPERLTAARPTDTPARTPCASAAGFRTAWDTGFVYT